jgi:hypothetical protein
MREISRSLQALRRVLLNRQPALAVDLISKHVFFSVRRATRHLSPVLGDSKQTASLSFRGWHKPLLIPIVAKWALHAVLAIAASCRLAIESAVLASAFGFKMPVRSAFFRGCVANWIGGIGLQWTASQTSTSTLDFTSGFVKQFPKYSSGAVSLRRVALWVDLNAAFEIKRRLVPGTRYHGVYQRNLYQQLCRLA